MRRKAIRAFAVMFAGVAIILATQSGASARSTGAISSTHPHMGSQAGPAATSASWHGRGWGYGRGWCYWHPYACYRAQ